MSCLVLSAALEAGGGGVLEDTFEVLASKATSTRKRPVLSRTVLFFDSLKKQENGDRGLLRNDFFFLENAWFEAEKVRYLKIVLSASRGSVLRKWVLGLERWVLNSTSGGRLSIMIFGALIARLLTPQICQRKFAQWNVIIIFLSGCWTFLILLSVLWQAIKREQ